MMDEQAQTMAVAKILAAAERAPRFWRRYVEAIFQREVTAAFGYHGNEIAALHLPADDETNALARLREVLGISE